MGAFNINITGVGGHGCERKAKPGEKLYGRCGRFTCPDCAAYDFVQRLKQGGMLSESGTVDIKELGENDPVPVGAQEIWLDTQVRTDAPIEKKRYAKFPHVAEFTHWPGSPNTVVDDMLTNERKAGSF